MIRAAERRDGIKTADSVDVVKQLFSGSQGEPKTREGTKMADKKMTVEEVNEYMKKQCGFVPRMFQIIKIRAVRIKCVQNGSISKKGGVLEALV